MLQPTRRGSWAPHGLCVSRGGGVKTGATLPWPLSGWSLQFVFAVLTRRSPIEGSGCQGCAAPSGARPGLDAGATGDYIAWPSKDGKRQRPDAGQGSGPRAAPHPRGRPRHAPAMGSLPPASCQPHTARQSKTVRPTAERSDRRGVWGHAATTLHASPRQRRVRHARAPPVPRHVQGRRPLSASTEAWRACP